MAKKKKYDYFDAFEQQVDLAIKEADLLIEVIENFTTAEDIARYLPRAHEIEHAGDVVNHDTYYAVAADFIPPIDREDILEISSALDDVIDDIEDVINLLYIMNVADMHDGALKVAKMLRECCKCLKVAMHEFFDFKKSKKFRHAIEDVNEREEEADALHAELMGRLFREEMDDPIRVVIWSRIFVRMENCIDNCEHVADIVTTVLVKNS